MSKKDRFDYLRIAKQLCYPEEVLEKLRKAKDNTEATNIMIQARRNMHD